MHPEEAPVQAAVERLRATFGEAPPTAIVLGSGLGPVVERVEVTREASYTELGLPASGVVGHAGRAIRGRLGPTEVLLLAGRVHLYEGWRADEVVRAVRALHRWGVKNLLLTCSGGGLADALSPGALLLLTDHINLMGDSPLRGEPWQGVRFPDMSVAHHPHLREVLQQAASELEVPLHTGVYAAVMGPAYETPAEVRMLKALGADVVGMSTVPELLAAAQLEMPVAAVAVISNMGAGLTDGPIDHGDVTRIAGEAAKGLARVFEVACARF